MSISDMETLNIVNLGGDPHSWLPVIKTGTPKCSFNMVTLIGLLVYDYYKLDPAFNKHFGITINKVY